MNYLANIGARKIFEVLRERPSPLRVLRAARPSFRPRPRTVAARVGMGFQPSASLTFNDMKTKILLTGLVVALFACGCGTLPRTGQLASRRGDESWRCGTIFHTGTRVVFVAGSGRLRRVSRGAAFQPDLKNPTGTRRMRKSKR